MSKLICLVLGIAFATTAAFGQSEIGGATLNGIVTDASAAVVPNAKLTVTNSQTGLKRTIQTSEAGFYNFSRLPVGTYDLVIEAAGFKNARRSGINLEVGAVASVAVTLEIGAAQDTVTVTAEAPVVESTRSQSSTTVSEKAVANLPVNGRNFIDFTTLTPGVVKDPTRGGDLSFAGQRGPSNTLLVDGGDSNNLFYGQATGRTGFRPYAFSQDAVQEFQVSAGEYPAEIGRAGGGAINAVTKSGTNEFHGSAFEFYRDKGMNANTFTNNRAGIRKQPYHFNQFGGSVGGPVLKDKLFFFGNYDGQRNTQTQPIVPNTAPTGAALAALQQYLTPYQTGLNNDVFLGKADWNAGQADHFSFRYNGSRYNGTNFESNGLSSAREHTGDNKVTTDNIAAAYTKIFGTSLVWDTRFNFVGDKEPGEANATGPEVVITNGITFGKNNFSPRFTNAYTYQPISTLSWAKGSHNVKFGFDFNFARIDNFFPGLFAGSYTFANYDTYLARTPSRYQQAFSAAGTTPPLSHPNVNEYSFFAQDSWRVSNRLTLNYGIRYDYFGYNQPNTKNADPGLAAQGLRTDVIPTDSSNVGPRFGFAFKPFHHDRTVIRGGYGIYYSRTPGLLLSTAILQNGIDVLTYSFTPGTALLPTYPNIISTMPGIGLGSAIAFSPDIDVTDSHFKSAATQQYSLQAETALGRDYSVTIGYLGVHATHLARSRDINLYPSALTAGSIAGAGAQSYFRHPGATAPARPNTNFGRITLFESGASSMYNGVFIQLQKRFSRNFQLLTSYTLAKVIDTAPDGTAVVSGNGGDDAKIAQDTLAPNLERGPGVTDIRHRFVFSAVWDLTYGQSMSNLVMKQLVSGWQLASISQVQSGRRFSATVTGDPNNDGNNNNDRVPLVGRNTIQGPAFMTWDLRLSRDIPVFRERVKLKLLGEAFNITNRANFNALQTNMYTFRTGVFTPTTNFLFRQSTFDPRILQLAVKLTF